MTDEPHVFDDIPEFDVVGDLQRQVSEARAEVAQLREALETWLTRYGQILAATDKLLHEIRFCSNADELWRKVGFSQEVEDLHTRVIYEADAVLHGRDPETRSMTDDLRTRAEQIVRDHEDICFGVVEPATAYCSVAPSGEPLCPSCRKLADAIESALTAAEQRIATLEQERDEARKDARYHHDCRPNRRQAEAAMADAKATNDRWADEVKARRAAEERAEAAETRLTAQEAEIATLRQRLDEAKAEALKWSRIRQPTHGRCCTCQVCGLPYDDCHCEIDELRDSMEQQTKEIATLRAELAKRNQDWEDVFLTLKEVRAEAEQRQAEAVRHAFEAGWEAFIGQQCVDMDGNTDDTQDVDAAFAAYQQSRQAP